MLNTIQYECPCKWGQPLSDDNKPASEDEISDWLLHVPPGHHYLILYPNIETMRKVYASYVKKQLKEQPDSVVLFLSYYDTTDNVRHVLSSNVVPVKEHEKNGHDHFRYYESPS